MLPNLLILDFETTGLCPEADRVVEVGGLVVRGGLLAHQFQYFVRQPEHPISPAAQRVNGIGADQVASGYPEKKAFALLKWLLAESTIVCHHAGFDVGFLQAAFRRHELGEVANDWLCTKVLAEVALPGAHASLAGLCARIGRKQTLAHRALGDALDTWAILDGLLNDYNATGRSVLPMNAVSGQWPMSPEQWSALPTGKAWLVEKGGRAS